MTPQEEQQAMQENVRQQLSYDDKKQQAFAQWLRKAKPQEMDDYLKQSAEVSDEFRQRMLRLQAGPSYAEDEKMPQTSAQRLTNETARAERLAREEAGGPARDDLLRSALSWREQGYYAPDQNPSMPPPTIGELAPRPENEFQSEVQGGAPISDVRPDMTPQEEQAAMQNFVRARLMQQQQLNLTSPQLPVDPNLLQRPPLAPGVPPASTPEVFQVPGLEVTGDYAMGNKFGQTTQPFDPKVFYRRSVPF